MGTSEVLLSSTANFADTGSNSSSHSVDDLAEFVSCYPNLFAITGAGISSESGIPTYRDDSGNWKGNRPIQHSEFMNSHAARQRYWARSFSGWPAVQKAQPNGAHRALAKLESLNLVQMLLTQNVDRLHQRANHRQVVDLHGRLDEVICMDCGAIVSRSEIQDWLKHNNPQLTESADLIRPDGDAEVDDGMLESVQIPACNCCGGLLKPNVVFYGSSVDKGMVSDIYQKLAEADSLLIVGSSLMVYSSFRFCKFAAENGIPIACINQGRTRADQFFDVKVAQPCGQALGSLLATI